MRSILLCVILLLPGDFALGGDLIRFEENGKIGLKDEQGNVVIPPSFEALGWSDGQFSVIGQITGYKLGEHWGLINLQKHLITPALYESMTHSGGDRMIASFQLNSFTVKYGCLDLTGKVVVPFRYDGIRIRGLRAVVFVKNGVRYEYGVIDLNDKSIIPMRYTSVSPIGALRYAVENDSARTAIFSNEGVPLTGFVIDSIGAFHKGYAMVHQGFAKGLMDGNGNFKLKPEYREIRLDENGQISVREFEEWKLLDKENHVLQSIAADQLDFLNQGLYRITLDNKSGLLDAHLEELLPPRFEYLSEANNGRRVVRINNRYGVIQKDFSWLLPPSFDTVCIHDNFIRAARRANEKMSWALYDTFGIQKTSTLYEKMEAYNGHFFQVKKYGYWGAVNQHGEEFLNCVFDSINDTRAGLTAVRFKGQYGIVDEHEKWLIPVQSHRLRIVNRDLYLEEVDSITFLKRFSGSTIYFTTDQLSVEGNHLLQISRDQTEKHISFDGLTIQPPPIPVAIPVDRTFAESEGLRGFVKDGKYGFIDVRGRLRIANRYDDIGEFHEGLAPFKLIGKWGYMSVQDEIVIHPNYDVVYAFQQQRAIVSKGGKSGILNPEGNLVLPLRYDTILRLSNHTFLLKMNGLFGLADESGNVLIENRFDVLESLPNGLVRVGQQGKFGLLTRDGMSIVPMIYDQFLYDAARDRFLGWKKTQWKRAFLD